MPLRDHFQGPFGDDWPWDGVYSAWANAIAAQLNRNVLPAGYYAIPLIKRGSQIEIDVATLQQPGVSPSAAGTAVWTAPRPAMSEVVDFTDLDVFEVQIMRRQRGPQLRAAVELVSPANKDRPSNRHAFAVKCASFLYRGVSVVLINVNTERLANMHSAILDVLRLTEVTAWQSPTHLSAVSYRMTFIEGKHLLDAWPEPLAVGRGPADRLALAGWGFVRGLATGGRVSGGVRGVTHSGRVSEPLALLSMNKAPLPGREVSCSGSDLTVRAYFRRHRPKRLGLRSTSPTSPTSSVAPPTLLRSAPLAALTPALCAAAI